MKFLASFWFLSASYIVLFVWLQTELSRREIQIGEKIMGILVASCILTFIPAVLYLIWTF